MAGGSVIGALRVILGADTAEFEEGLKRAEKVLSKTGKNLQSIGKTLSATVTAPLVGFAMFAVDQFQESEKAIAAVEAALKSTGGTAGFTSKQLQEMAKRLQEVSTFGDDDILSKVTANLLTFTNVAGPQFERAQQAVLDLSARLGQDLQQSAIMVGKALNDPILGITALRRVGIQLTEQQEEQIRGFVASGEAAKAQGIILDELARQFGGQAKALADTTGGQLTQAWNAWGDAMESVGQIVATVLPPIANAIKAAADAFSSLSPETQQWIVIVGGIAAAVGPAVIALGLMLSALAVIGLPLAAVIAGVTALTAAVVAFWPQIVMAKDMALLAVQQLYDGIKLWLVDMLTPVWETVNAAITKVKDTFQWLYETVVGRSIVPDMVDGVIGEFQRMNAGMVPAAEAGAKAIESAYGGMSRNVAADISAMSGDLRTIFGVIFKDSKAAAIANAIISVNEGIARALAQPWPLNLTAAAATAAKGFAAIQAIQSTNIGSSGGGRGGGGGGGGRGAVAAPAPAAPAAPDRSAVITLNGQNFDREGVRKLVEQIGDFLKDGGKLVFA